MRKMNEAKIKQYMGFEVEGGNLNLPPGAC